MSSPNPTWKPGDKIQAPAGSMVEVDPAKISVPDFYKLLISAVIPRPIAFVSTVSAAGVANLAPFSFFNGISSNPPCIMISGSRRRTGEKKDTIRNIEETGQFVVNSSNEWLIEPLVQCSGEYPYGVDEMKQVGLTPVPSLRVKPPRVQESALQMECVLYKSVEIGEDPARTNTVIFGRVVLVHVNSAVYKDGKVIPQEFKPIARLGGTGYAKIGEIFEIPVPKV